MPRPLGWALLLAMLTYFGAANAEDLGAPAVFPQLGHSDTVTSLAFSPDGKTVVSGSLDHSIKLWDVASGRLVRTLQGHAKGVGAVAVSPDGALLASGGEDGVNLWDLANGQLLRAMGPDDDARWVAFTADGRVLIVGIAWGDLEFRDVASGGGLRAVQTPGRMAGPVAASSDAMSLSWANVDGSISVWDVARAKERLRLGGLGSAARAVLLSPDGARIVTADPEAKAGSAQTDSSIRVWDAANGHQLERLDGAADGVLALSVSPNSRILAVSGEDRAVTLWDMRTGKALRTLDRSSCNSPAMVFSPDGTVLATAGRDAITLWNVADGREIRQLAGHTDWLRRVAVSPDGKTLASGGNDKTVKLWDAASGRQLRSLSGALFPIDSVAFSPDGRVMASGSFAGEINLWDIASGRVLGSLDVHRADVTSLAFSPDGALLASAGWDKTVVLSDVASGRYLRTFIGHEGFVESVAFSPDGRLLASGGFDDKAKIWDVATGQEVRTLSGHGEVYDVAFSPDGTVLATAETGSTAPQTEAFVKLWDVASGRLTRSLSRATGGVHAVAFSHDGTMLATGGDDQTIMLWSAADGRQLRTLTGHLGYLTSVAFSPDDKGLVSGSWDGTMREWDVATGRERVALVSFEDESSIAVTPEGFFDSSSAAAEDNLNVRVGRRVFGISSFRDNFYRPDLVKLSLAGQSLASLGGIEKVKLSPVVELVDPPQSFGGERLELKVRITDAGGGVGPVRLFSGGAVILQDDTSPTSPGATELREYAVPLAVGANDLSVTVQNAAGDMWSEARTSVVATRAPGKPNATHGMLHALIIGIQEFPNVPWNTLKYPVADADLFAQTLQAKGGTLFAGVDIDLLTSADDTTKDRIVAALEAMQKRVAPGDTFVFYVASHGYVSRGDYLLITSNVGRDANRLRQDTLSRHQLTDLLANIPTTHKIAFIDTCQAGALAAEATDPFATRGMNPETAATIISREIGLTMLMASTTEQHAFEGYQKHGLFTWVLNEGLMGKAAEATTGIVSSSSLAAYVSAGVPPLALSVYGKPQQPVADESGRPFALTKAN
jgi:WD40 repeat protein